MLEEKSRALHMSCNNIAMMEVSACVVIIVVVRMRLEEIALRGILLSYDHYQFHIP